MELEKTYETLVKPHLADITNLRNQGYKVHQICKFLGISCISFYGWMKEHSELYDAWEEGQVKLVEALEAAANRKALGYQYEELEETILFDADDAVYGRKVTKRTKTAHPDGRLISKLLAVLHPKKYKAAEAVEDKDIQILLDSDLDELAE